MTLKRSIVWNLALILILGVSSALAGVDIEITEDFTEDGFRKLSEEIGFAISYFPLAPAEGLGVPGVDISIQVRGINITEDSDYWSSATQETDVSSYLIVPALQVRVGLPKQIDIGAFYAMVPDSNVKIQGAEVKWAFLKGGTVTPALAARAAYTRLNGVDHLEMNTKGIDLSISKGFTFFTPYAGAGLLSVRSEAADLPFTPAVPLDESFIMGRYFAGARFTFGIVAIVAEYDRGGGVDSLTAKLSLHF
ncbi:MAG: DUF6588 family protein [Acidobacteriota bacterium]